MRTLTVSSWLVSAFLVAAAAGCSEQEFHEVADRPDEGDLTLTGWVCDTERNTWLEGANVYTHLLDSDGVLYSTITVQTDAQGQWVMDGLHEGSTYLIYVTYGSALLDQFEVTMPGADHVLDQPDCAGNSELEVAVVTGDYDDFGEVLSKVGVGSYDLINGQTGADLVQFLTNADAVGRYDAIFFAGGHIEEDVFYDSDGSDVDGDVGRVKQALRDFVDGGGAVYASDWSYDVVEQTWPSRIDFLGDDKQPGDAQKGATGKVSATVTDDALVDAIKNDTVPLVFDLDAWPVVESVEDGVQVYLEGDAPYQEGFSSYTLPASPLLVSFPSGKGRVIFSSWRQTANADGRGLATIKYMMTSLTEE